MPAPTAFLRCKYTPCARRCQEVSTDFLQNLERRGVKSALQLFHRFTVSGVSLVSRVSLFQAFHVFHVFHRFTYFTVSGHEMDEMDEMD